MSSYCPPGIKFYYVWYNSAFNPCLVNTLKAVVLAALMGTCGVLEFRMYRRFGTPLDPGLLKPVPPLYILQLISSALIFLLQPLRFGLRFLGGYVYGYAVLLDVTGTAVWLGSAMLIFVERNFDLPCQPGRGHSMHLSIFWGSALVLDTLEVVNVRGPEWWFSLNDKNVDSALLSIFILQWIAELSLFILGLKAPGIVTNRQRNNFFYRPMEEHPKYGSVSASSGAETEEFQFDNSVEIMRLGLTTGDLGDQFMKLDRQSTTMTLKDSVSAAKKRENEVKNRYWNVLPYDFNRVVLKDGPDGNDYINASGIEMRICDLDLTNHYIASQGPKPETVADFWWMIWEQKCPIILMLTEIVEAGMRKCEQYWPAINDKLELNGLVIGAVAESSTKVSSVREFFLVHLESQQHLTVVQIQFHGWPDHGAPKETKRFLDYWRQVRNKLPHGDHPIVIHCSAGIGRTGAYILMETLILMIEAEVPLRPIEIVRQLREQRMASVQTKEQFLYACKTALDYLDQRKRRRN